MFIPFPEYRPDVSDFRGQHTQVMSGVLPRGDGWGPFPSLQNYSGVLESGNDTYTKVLLHFDGTDAGTTITDSNVGGSAHTWTAAGNANTDTAIKKFGTASLLCDGTGDWVTTPDHADFNLGSGDFTVDCWFNCTAAGGTERYIAGQTDNSASASTISFYILRTAANVISAVASTGPASGITLTGTTQFTDALNTGWHHVALVRSGDVATLYIDGVAEDSDAMVGTVIDSSNDLGVGVIGEIGNNGWTGSIDEFRISVGIARWTADFNVELAPYGADSTGQCRGYFSGRNLSDGSVVIFAGSSTRLYKLNNSTLKWEDVSKSATAYTTLASTDQWQFVQFGSVVIAVNSNTAPQAFTIGSSSAFADLGGTPPNSRYIAVVGRQILLSGQTSNVRRVSWCDVDGITTWTAGTGFANYYDLPDGGVVRGVAGGEFGLVFQESAIRRLTYIPGASPSFQIERITEDKGLLGPYSIVRAGERVAFISPQGILEYRPGVGLVPIGKERVDRTILADIDREHLNLLIGSADPAGTRYVWAYKSVGSSDETTFDKVLVYDYGLERWSPFIETRGEYLSTAIKPGLTLESLDDISASLDDLDITLDSIQVALTARLSAFTSDSRMGFFDGDNLEAVLETPEQGGERRMIVRGFFPRTDADTVYGSIRYRINAQSNLSQTSETLVNEIGFCPQRIDTRLARGRVRIPAGEVWTYCMGISPEYGETGRR
jgi:hypothetical protein